MVAAMHCSAPRASSGFSSLPTCMLAPAWGVRVTRPEGPRGPPTSVCTSSILQQASDVGVQNAITLISACH